VTILLDENFPLGLARRLRADGLVADHIITLGWRGASDARIRERLQDRELVFLTQDEDFLLGQSVPALVVVSRVRQARPLGERIEVWRQAVRTLVEQTPEQARLFELTDEGILVPWRDVSGSEDPSHT
jgi:hypothetical protein